MSQSALHHAAREGDLEHVQDLVDGRNGHLKVELDVRDMCGRTPLHLAARWGRLKVVQFLIEAGANVQCEDDSGKTPMDVASENKIRLMLDRSSLKLRARIESTEQARADETALILGQRQAGTLTDWEAKDAVRRTEQKDLWDQAWLAAKAEDLELAEEAAAQSNEDMVTFLATRPGELEQDAYERSLKMLRKRRKEERKRQLEQARAEEARALEERRLREKQREERREQKELHRPRRCRHCGQTFTAATNRSGLCVHSGKWSNWGTDSKGLRVEWLFEWTCCHSKAHEGPANGLSTCSRSEPHEESEEDLARRQARRLAAIS